jgi:hypothetical protein
VAAAGVVPRSSTWPGTVTGARGARSAPVDAAEIPRLEDDYRRDPGPRSRRVLARAYVRTGRAGLARRLLAPHWDDPLDTAGRMLLLEADRALGDARRARELARDLGPGGGPVPPAPADPLFWALVAFTCLDLGHREEGLRALDAAIALDPENVSLRSHRVFLTEHGVP